MIIQRNGCPPPTPTFNRFNSLVRGGFSVGQLVALLLVLLLALPPVPAAAKTRKGDKIRAEARTEELKGNFDRALELAEQAYALDPGDPSYNLELRRVRFEAGAIHVKNGQKLRLAGKLDEALAEFEKAFGIDPASDIAAQEVRRTREMIRRNATGGDGTASLSPEERKVLTPSEVAKRETQDRTDSLLPVAELRPLNTDPIDLKMTNKPRVLFETVAKVAGINVLFDPEYTQQQTIPQVQIDLNRTTLEESLDQIAVVTKSFWKPLSKNAIFVTVDNPTKRREYAEQVVKVFYLSNVTSPQEMQELLTVLRTVVDVQKVFNYTSQNALVVRAESDTMALVEKLIADLDKPRGEVIVDVMVMEVSSTYMRNLTAAFAPTGLTLSAVYNKGSTTTTPASGTGTTPTTTTTNPLTLNRLGRISSQDYSLTNLPGAQFEAVLNDSATRVLQSPQIRAADKAKASIKIGDKVPTATGSFQPGVGSVGVSPLVNTQFTFLDVGVKVEITPFIHDNNEVSMHLDLDVSQVKSRIDLGGVSEPIIGQNTLLADIRLRDGEVNLIGGIIQQTDSKAKTGIPGLASIPVLGRLFSGENIEKDRTELVIAIVPHIVRGPDVTRSNLLGVAAGNATQIKVGYSPRKPALIPVTPGAAPIAGGPPATAPPMSVMPATIPLGGPPATAPALNEPAPGAAPPEPAPPVPAFPPPSGPGPSLPGFARLSFLPGNSVDTQLSQSVTVTIYAENVKDLTEAVARIQFDPKILRVNNIVAGDLPQRGGVVAQPSKNILNDAGQAEVSFSRETGVSGSGGLFTVVLQAVGRGNTMITLSGITMKGMNGVSIPSNVPPALVVNVK
jgi:general secretion pathway protein D